MKRPDVLERAASLGHVVRSHAWDLNIIGIRSSGANPEDKFDDLLSLTYHDGTKWVEHLWPVTTDAGKFYQDHPMNNLGTAKLEPGQYINCWKIGMHRDRYKALVQCAPVTVRRNSKLYTGMYGINIHRAASDYPSVFVHKWSAGCTVFSDPNDFQSFMSLCSESGKRLQTPYYSYTLLEEW